MVRNEAWEALRRIVEPSDQPATPSLRAERKVLSSTSRCGTAHRHNTRAASELAGPFKLFIALVYHERSRMEILKGATIVLASLISLTKEGKMELLYMILSYLAWGNKSVHAIVLTGVPVAMAILLGIALVSTMMDQ